MTGEITIISKPRLLCDVCDKPLTEESGGRVKMAIDAILTEWGLYCVRASSSTGFRKEYEKRFGSTWKQESI